MSDGAQTTHREDRHDRRDDDLRRVTRLPRRCPPHGRADYSAAPRIPSRRGAREAVLLDAYGTLVTLDDPSGRLGRCSRRRATSTRPSVAAALAAEIVHYRAHHDEGRDRATLASLRLRCAAVLAEGLGDDVLRCRG